MEQELKIKKGFTLVELLIVITVLGILMGIGFISFQSYISNSRDSNRVSTIKQLEIGLNIFQTQTSILPEPEGSLYTGNIGSEKYTKQGEIGKEIGRMLNVGSVPVDPLYDSNYKYSITIDKQKFMVAGILEKGIGKSNFIVPTTYAGGGYQAYGLGSYGGIMKYSSGSEICVANIPSIMFSNEEDRDLLSSGTYFVVSKEGNLPYKIPMYAGDNIGTQKLMEKILHTTNVDIVGVCGNSLSEVSEEIKSNTGLLNNFGGQAEQIDYLFEGKVTINQIVDAGGTGSGTAPVVPVVVPASVTLIGPSSVSCSGCSN